MAVACEILKKLSIMLYNSFVDPFIANNARFCQGGKPSGYWLTSPPGSHSGPIKSPRVTFTSYKYRGATVMLHTIVPFVDGERRHTEVPASRLNVNTETFQ